MISEELLSEVLGKPVYMLELVLDKRYIIIYHDNGVMNTSNISIYELAHKCKEWAWVCDNIRLESGRRYGTSATEYNCCISVYNGHKYYFDGEYKNFIADTEPEAIFKATQWILERIKDDK